MMRTLLCIFVTIHLCKGVPLDISDILGRVEKYLQESGSTRMKRETGYAKEYKMERDGVGMGIAYNEASDKEGYFFFRVKDVDVNVEYNIARWSEGYFDIVLRVMNAAVIHRVTVTNMPGEDGRYTTKIAIDSTAVQFNFTADTDWENSGTFYLQYETQGEKSYKEDIKLNLVRDGYKKLKIDAIRNGAVYGVDADANVADMNGNILVKTPDRDYKLNGRAAIKGDWKVSIEGDAKGPLSFLMLMKKDYSEAKLELSHRNNKMIQAKIKAQEKGDGSREVKAKYMLFGGKLGKGDVFAVYKDGEVNVEVSPQKKPKLNIHQYFLPTYVDDMLTHLKFGFESDRAGSKIASYSGELTRENTTAVYSSKFHSELEVIEGTLIYTSFCKLGETIGGGCFKTRNMIVETFYDKVEQNTFGNKQSMYLKNSKDGETNLEFDMNSNVMPYKFKVVSPLLTEHLDTDTFYVTADHQEGESLTVETNYQDHKVVFHHGPENQNGVDGRGYHGVLSKAGVTSVKYDLFVDYKRTPEVSTKWKGNSKLYVNPESIFYTEVVCKTETGCWSERTAVVDIFADHTQTTPVFRLSVDIANDGVSVIKTNFKTQMTANILTIELTSTNAELSSFLVDLHLVENTGSASLNGKQVATFTVDPDVPLNTKDGWEKNKLKLDINGPDTDIDAEAWWDGDGVMDVTAGGTSKYLGAFNFHRKIDAKETGTGFSLYMEGETESEKGHYSETGLNVPLNLNLDINTVDHRLDGTIGSDITITNNSVVFH